jgi:RND superfamily putative drug exporter
MASFLHRLGHLAVRRRRTVVSAWVGVLIGISLLDVAVGGGSTENFVIPGSESQAAFDLLEERFPEAGGSTTILVFVADEPDGIQGEIELIDAALAKVGVIEGVDRVAGPSAGGAFSADGRVALAQVHYPVSGFEVDRTTVEAVVDVVDAARTDHLAIEIGGEVMLGDRPGGGTSEAVGLAVAMVVLLFSFGSMVAMGLPIATAAFGLGVAIGGMGLLSATLDLSADAPKVGIMIGLAVGIDYALFILSRYRENLTLGLRPEEAIARANATAGGAVVFAGATVLIALSSLTVIGIPYVSGLGLGPAIAVGIAVLLAVTLLPALLGFAGPAIDRLAVPRLARRARESSSRETLAARWARFVTGRPRRFLACGVLFMAILTLPVFSIRLGFPDASSDPPSTTQRRAYDAMSESFGPGINGPLVVAADLTPTDDPVAASELVRHRLSELDGVAFVLPPALNPDRDTVAITVVPTAGPRSDVTEGLLRRLRGDVRDDIETGTGLRYSVTGNTAIVIDLMDRLNQALVPFVTFVLGLTLLLLLVVFRSILVPLKAALAILLSIGASLGVVVAVFQWGWLANLIGVHESPPIVSFVPMMMFAILFGLSMDYEVFILTRIREAYATSGDARSSVLVGISSSAQVITTAALIMISVFAAFVLGDQPVLKMFGLGLAVAVFLDATVVRMIIVPAAMTLLGDRAWWLPRSLDRVLPNLDVEGQRLAERLNLTSERDP